ncbi:TPA: glycosyltransferase family 52 [Streptococcus agalactiae]|uniref:Capsular polysaccharide biosynthesis protein CpsK n=1 Tax=Streptococcus agalactiae TaxID=1311 RepID=A0A1N6LYV9_STRAG|nr:glycosyltransferase family 52 [Streptococcus agalactiae]SIO74100.1 capsular polysaccharide biosynthesis protein CpsK [Streptococcus agalactiae]VEJ12965.1 Capsular polysaccharide biosynthesis protein CpsK(V) [Streptococcus agalactiae]HEM9602784.1 capsular biosynthesis protein [Streptococcus agalactiae]HEM9657077.1 capsular biosynthesis protein [Streptococcus agalactiae]HEM9663105.1 capsular biosynthesis protein [Streptococcus agalactiae]
MNYFVCHTLYHLLITIIKLKDKENTRIFICDTIPDYEAWIKILNNQGIKTELFKELDYREQLQNKNVEEVMNLVDSYLKHYFERVNAQVYLFNDDTLMGRYMAYLGKNYHLIEDGYNCFQAKLFFGGSVVKRIIKTYFLKKYVPYGFSKYCLSIEVNSLEGLPHDRRSKKYKELPRKELFDSLTQEQKSLIFKLFKMKPITIAPKSVLLLTQPLAQDKWYKTATERFQSIQEQYDYFEGIVHDYRERGYNIYLKVHPRDAVDYSKLPVELLPSNIPMEIIELMLTGRFEVGITHSSTALDFLTCVDRKIILVNLKDIK